MHITDNEIQQFLKNFDSAADLLEPSRRTQDADFPECSKLETRALRAMTQHGNLKMGELAEIIKVPLSTATRIIDQLEKKDLVERKHSVQDKRIILISFTTLGKQINQYILQERAELARTLLDGLSENQRKQFFRQLNKLVIL